MELLTVSDIESCLVYSPKIKQRFKNTELAISCGDLPYRYLEYIISSLDIPLYYVRGNHAKKVEYGCLEPRQSPWGAIDLHKRVVRDSTTGLLLAGIEGSLRYNDGDYQYTQLRMWWMVMQLVPRLLWNKLRFGRYLDIFISHAPPWGIHDQEDRPHRGIRAFKWLVKTFKPTFHIHGHIHVYQPWVVTETKLGQTIILNTYGFKRLNFPSPQKVRIFAD